MIHSEGVRRLLAEFRIEPEDLKSLRNFTFSAWRMTKSELFVERYKNYIIKDEAITKFMHVDVLKAQMSTGQVLSWRRGGGYSIRRLKAWKAHLVGLGLDATVGTPVPSCAYPSYASMFLTLSRMTVPSQGHLLLCPI
jgi:hypothetical protein